MQEEIAVVGAGVTKFGKRFDVSYRELMAEAASEAINSMDRPITPNQIQGLYVAASIPELTVDQAHVANLAAQELGLEPEIIARVEMACSSGSTAIRNAWAAIKSGLIDTALVVGLEKMYANTQAANHGLCIVPDVTYEATNGITAYSGFALIAQEHMKLYGTTRDQLSSVSVKNHSNGAKNPKAQFFEKGEITLEEAKSARMVSDPLNLYDCSPITDGGAAVILTRGSLTTKFSEQPVWIKGSGQSVEPSLGVSNMKSLTEWTALKRAAQKAYQTSGISPSDIDVAEVHDCFTIAEIIEYEDLGFTAKGTGGKFIEDGESALSGSLPVNTSGGLKAKGHPIGATGVAQVVEITEQLQGKSGKRQVDGANIGLTHNLSGFATHHVVHILSNEEAK